jgi:hypothetical protein
VALVVWYEIFKWLGVVIVMPPNLFYLFVCLIGTTMSKNSRKGYMMVWHSVRGVFGEPAIIGFLISWISSLYKLWRR